MRLHRYKVDLCAIERANNHATTRRETTCRDALRYLLDPAREDRLAASECVICFMADRVGGASSTERPCGLCDTVLRTGNTNIDVLCLKCAQREGLCKHCGADLDLKNRRSRKQPVFVEPSNIREALEDTNNG